MITIQQSEACGREVISHTLTHVDRETSVLEASKLMRKSHTTELLVTDAADGVLFPVGIVTAIDIVTLVVAAELDPSVLTTGDIAWSGAGATGNVEAEASWFHQAPAGSGEVLAVMDGDGRVVGTVKLDDISEAPGS